MATRRRWLQFSLRSFLIVLTIGCVWLGWKVEKGRRRGKAIDALVVAGAVVFCRQESDQSPYIDLKPESSGNHFWLDWKGVPVFIQLPMPLDAAISSQLSHIYGTGGIEIRAETADADLRYLNSTDARKIVLSNATHVTDGARERLQHKLPNADIEVFPSPMLLFDGLR